MLVEGLAGLVDEGQHVAHAQDAAGHAVGVEGLDVGELLADAAELDGLARHRAHGQGRAAAGVAVQLGEDHAVHAELLVEGLGHVHGVLTGHGVHHQEDFLGLHGLLDPRQLVHQLGVDVQPAGGIDDQHVPAVVPGVLDGLLGSLDGILGALLEHGHLHLLAHHLQLLDGRRAVDVAGGQHGLLALLGQVAGQLGGHGGFARALKAAEHVDRRQAGGPGQPGVGAAHQLGHFLADDLDDLLPGGQGGQHLLAHALLRNLLDEVLGHGVVDVSLQQCHAHLAHALLDGLLGQLALAGHFLQGALQLFTQALKGHCFPPDPAG